MFDVVFLSYDESTASARFNELVQVIPTAVHVSGVRGIAQAHVAAARAAATEMVFIVDADTEIIDHTVFSFDPPVWDREYTHLWYAQNEVNGSVYGYGGLKCFNRQKLLKANVDNYVDFCSSVSGLKVLATPVAITRFDHSPFATFRAVVREVVKLTAHLRDNPRDRDTEMRLNQWKTRSPNTKYFQPYLLGLETAAVLSVDPTISTSAVNDFDFIKLLWDRC